MLAHIRNSGFVRESRENTRGRSNEFCPLFVAKERVLRDTLTLGIKQGLCHTSNLSFSQETVDDWLKLQWRFGINGAVGQNALAKRYHVRKNSTVGGLDFGGSFSE